jgi:hypothetical protein
LIKLPTGCFLKNKDKMDNGITENISFHIMSPTVKIKKPTFNPYDLDAIARYRKLIKQKYINRTPNKEPYNIGLNLNDKNK